MTTIFGGAPATAKGTFGEHLRREREMRGVSLDEVSQSTRITTRFLEALENERWQDLPGGVFNRGFLRSIARYLGLDEEALVAEYAQATNDRPQMAEWAASVNERGPAPRQGAGRKSSARLVWLTLLLVCVAAGAAGWWGWTEYGSVVRAWRSPLPVVPQAKPPAAPAVSPNGDSTGINMSVTNPPGANPPGAAPQAAEDLELRVEVSRSTDVTISGDGKTLFQGRMNRGENRMFKAHDRFDVSAKNSFALVLELNGASLAPVGQPDSPGSVTLTHKDLAQARRAAGDSH
ncbi:MAG TPA: helix-turn-helix domain-containing protein [Candidatus Acidoferrales bacterium]|nr:helix-turn-helix domain-containing protein [Candidatus Acidoferrales bacterium]